MTQNPLEKLYRSKNLYISLPSKGNYYHSGIKLSVDGEIGIMPMTAIDEIKLKAPDALFNGEALYELFRSCVPDIANPEEIPNSDLDKLLMAIRVATTGTDLDITTTCPKCEKSETYQIDLTTIMNTAQDIPEDVTVELDDGNVVEITPLTLKNHITNSLNSFYHMRMQQLANSSESNQEETAKLFNEIMVQAIALQTNQVSDCIARVILKGDEEVEVTNRDHIFEWVENMDRITHSKIKEKITELSNPHIDNLVSIKCTNKECNHEYKTPIDLNPANFFFPRQQD